MEKTKTEKTQNDLKETIFERIENEKVCPKSKLFFRSQECVVWFLWVLSVSVGALAVAVSLFVVTHHQYALYEATHDNFLTFLVEALPYLWIILFGVMVYVAIYNLRHTSHGYRYPVSIILTSSVLLSVAGGYALQFFGFGYSVDGMLGDNMRMYMSQEKLEQRMWQNPSEGRLVGAQSYGTLSPTTTIIFKDHVGKAWIMDISELPEPDVDILKTRQLVKLMGMMVQEDVRGFHACGVFPWVHQKDITTEVLQAQRQVFSERIKEYARKAESEMVAVASELTSTTPAKRSVCAGITPVRKHLIESQAI